MKIRGTAFLTFVGVGAALVAAPLRIQKIDTNHSTIAFRVPILGGMSEVEGKFTDFAVDLTYDEEAPSKSSVVAVIQTTSVDTGIADRDKHLRSADFFDAAKFPEIRFESTRIEKAHDGFVATGQLTIRGVTKTIQLPFKTAGVQRDPAGKWIIVAFSAETHLNRRDYGVNWTHNVDPSFVGDDIGVVIHVLTKRVPLPGGA